MPHRREQFTILGASGLIGRNLCARLSAAGHDVLGLRRNDPLPRTPLGHLVYAIGLTADFRQRPFETMSAHVSCLGDVLQQAEFRSFLYLSSTRVYGTSSLTNEDALITCSPGDPDHLYNLSKLAGESLTLHCGRRNARVARLSNVVNPDCDSPNFLDSIIRDAVELGRVALNSHPQSSKDYVWLNDVVSILPQIAMNGSHSMYNVAGGLAVTHCEWLDALVKHTACSIEVAGSAPLMHMGAVNIDRAHHEFGFQPRPVLAELPQLLVNLKRRRCAA